MSDILDAAGHKLATIGEDGHVRNMMGAVIGRVDESGKVYNGMETQVGSFRSDGGIYKVGTQVGAVHPDGRVFDWQNHYIGKIVGDHIESGGAALLLLVR